MTDFFRLIRVNGVQKALEIYILFLLQTNFPVANKYLKEALTMIQLISPKVPCYQYD